MIIVTLFLYKTITNVTFITNKSSLVTSLFIEFVARWISSMLSFCNIDSDTPF